MLGRVLALDGPFCPWIHAADLRPRRHRWRVTQRRLTHWLLVCVIDGEEEIRVDGQRHAIPAGGTYCIQPGRVHSLGSRDDGGCTPVWVHFDLMWDPRRDGHPHIHGSYTDDIADRAGWMQPDARAVFGVDLPVMAPPRLAPTLRSDVPELVRWWQRGDPAAVLRSRQALGGILLAWAESAWGDGSRADLTADQRLARAEAIAEGALAGAFSIDDFAAAAGYSRSRFAALWRALRTGTPSAYLRERRMIRAARLLAHGEADVRAVATQVGYPDPTVFGRVFRRRFGLPPGRWRAGIRP